MGDCVRLKLLYCLARYSLKVWELGHCFNDPILIVVFPPQGGFSQLGPWICLPDFYSLNRKKSLRVFNLRAGEIGSLEAGTVTPAECGEPCRDVTRADQPAARIDARTVTSLLPAIDSAWPPRDVSPAGYQ